MQKSVLITGCSSGIGLEAARILHKRDYQVLATARQANDVKRLQAMGLTSFQLDLASSDSIEKGVEQALKITGGGLDALFNNGAFGQPGAVEDLSREALRHQFETNVFGWHELTCKIIPIMRQQGHGRIIHNSSILGRVVLPWRGAYNASKFALEGLTDTLRLELAGSGIQVCLIEPGPIESQFRANALKMFKQFIAIESSVHRSHYQQQLQRLSSEKGNMPFTLPPDAVVDKLLHALESKHPKTRYPVTVPAHVLPFISRFLPTAVMDAILRRL